MNQPKFMKAIDLLHLGDFTTFRVKNGKAEWEAMSWRGNSIFISRVVDTGGKPFLMGLRYQGRYIKSETLVEIVAP